MVGDDQYPAGAALRNLQWFHDFPPLRSVEDDPPAEGHVERREMAARRQG
jgi:hypothetical protein